MACWLCGCCRWSDFIEVEALHGYRTVLWTGNAKKALAAAHNRLVATIVATDIVDDILEYMLEVRRTRGSSLWMDGKTGSEGGRAHAVLLCVMRGRVGCSASGRASSRWWATCRR